MGADVRLVRVGEAGTFSNLLRETVPAVFIVSGRMNGVLRSALTRLRLAVPTAHLVVFVVHGDQVERVRSIVGPRTAVACPLPDPAVTCLLARRAWAGARIEVLRRRLDARRLHWLVRQAMHAVMSERFWLSDAPARHRLQPVRGIRDLSARCGAAEKTLRQHCRESGIDVGAFIAEWKTMLAVWARLLANDSKPAAWEQVARCLGYRDESGVRKLLARRGVHSVEPASLCIYHLDGILARLGASLGEGA